jgi:hypothetical protein
MIAHWRLILASLALVGWLGWLGYTSLTKSHAPIVSHAQAAAATAAVVVELNDDGTKAEVIDQVGNGKTEVPKGNIEVVNLPGARGFAGPGTYLLYLTATHGGWQIVGQQRSPGNDMNGAGPPIIYPCTDDVRKQAEKLKPLAREEQPK